MNFLIINNFIISIYLQFYILLEFKPFNKTSINNIILLYRLNTNLAEDLIKENIDILLTII